MRNLLIVLIVLVTTIAFSDSPDLMNIRHVPTKPRVQDQYNAGKDAALDKILAMGKDAIPFLIDRLSSKREYKHPPMDLYPRLSEGDLAYIILVDLFSDASEHQGTTVPELCWNNLLEASKYPGVPAWQLLDQFHKSHTPQQLQDRWSEMWKSRSDQIVWDQSQLFYRITGLPVINCN